MPAQVAPTSQISYIVQEYRTFVIPRIQADRPGGRAKLLEPEEEMPEIVDADAQREAALLATWQTLAQHGVVGVTIRRIAKEAGGSTGFIGHYFRDKQEVLPAAIRLSNEHP